MHTATLLYYHTTPAGFLQMLNETGTDGSLCLRAGNLFYSLSSGEYGYGHALFRKAIARYETLQNIPAERSKAGIPFFRADRLRLVGPDTEIFLLPFYESPRPAFPKKENAGTSVICLGLDYESLMEYCLFENASFFKCGYDEEQAVSFFMKELETEYDKFGFDEEHTLFAKGSRFASLLYSASSKWKEARFREESEWRITLCRPVEETEFHCEKDSLSPFFPLRLPASCLHSVSFYASGESFKLANACKLMLEKNGIDVNTVEINRKE